MVAMSGVLFSLIRVHFRRFMTKLGGSDPGDGGKAWARRSRYENGLTVEYIIVAAVLIFAVVTLLAVLMGKIVQRYQKSSSTARTLAPCRPVAGGIGYNAADPLSVLKNGVGPTS